MTVTIIKPKKGNSVLEMLRRDPGKGGIRHENIWNVLPSGISVHHTIWIRNMGDNCSHIKLYRGSGYNIF